MTTTPAQQPTTAPVLGDWQPLPNAGATPHTPNEPRLYRGKTLADWAIRAVLVAVMTAALAVGTWSIYTLLTQVFHVPQPVAILGCGMFDGAALFFALLSQRYATTTDSGFAPRAAMLAMVATSSWVNWQHAQLEHWGLVGGVILASAPAIAELAFLMFHKFAHRETLRALGRVPQALPTLGKWAWLAHPVRARRTVDAHVKAGLTEHEAVAKRREDLAADRARSIVAVPIAGPDRTIDAWTAVMDRADHPDPAPADRTALHGLDHADRMDRAIAGPDRPALDRTAQRTADRTERTTGTDTTDRTAGPVDRTSRSEATDRGPDRRTSATPRTVDRTDAALTLTEIERTAIDTLRSTDRSISKRSIQDVIRNELAGSIASDRAVQIARHFRTLRSAA